MRASVQILKGNRPVETVNVPGFQDGKFVLTLKPGTYDIEGTYGNEVSYWTCAGTVVHLQAGEVVSIKPQCMYGDG